MSRQTQMSINVRNGYMHYLPHGTHEDTQEPSYVYCARTPFYTPE